MDNYTKIKVVFKDNTVLYISEDEVAVFKLSGEYYFIGYLNDKERLHRLDGPAIEYADGCKSWYVDNQKHRLDGPAFDGVDGHKAWWENGKRHRLDGPAIEYADGHKEWWVVGRSYSQEEF